MHWTQNVLTFNFFLVLNPGKKIIIILSLMYLLMHKNLETSQSSNPTNQPRSFQ